MKKLLLITVFFASFLIIAMDESSNSGQAELPSVDSLLASTNQVTMAPDDLNALFQRFDSLSIDQALDAVRDSRALAQGIFNEMYPHITTGRGNHKKPYAIVYGEPIETPAQKALALRRMAVCEMSAKLAELVAKYPNKDRRLVAYGKFFGENATPPNN